MFEGKYSPTGATCTPSSSNNSQPVADIVHPLPYFAPADQLPAPLPTDEAIRQGGSDNHVFMKQRHTYDRCPGSVGRRVVRVGPHFLVKHGVYVDAGEGQAMLFVREACGDGVPVPRVYAVYTQLMPGGAKERVIVMEYIPNAQNLAAVWSGLNAATKSGHARQLRSIMDTLRLVPSPGYIGCIGRRPTQSYEPIRRAHTGLPGAKRPVPGVGEDQEGPYETEIQFNEATITTHIKIHSMHEREQCLRTVTSLTKYMYLAWPTLSLTLPLLSGTLSPLILYCLVPRN